MEQESLERIAGELEELNGHMAHLVRLAAAIARFKAMESGLEEQL